MILQSLLNLPKEKCVYGIVNKKDNKIYIGYTHNVLEALSRNVMEINLGSHICSQDKNDLEFIILETCNKDNLRIRYNYWVQKYKDTDTLLYKNEKIVTYSLHIDLGKDFRSRIGDKWLLYLKLRTVSHTERIIGVFTNKMDLDKFVSINYPNNVVNDFIVSNDEVTTQYLQFLKNNIKEL